MKIFLFFLSLLTVNYCHSEVLNIKPEWKIIYQSSNEVIKIDTKSIKRRDNLVSFWFTQENFGWKENYWLYKEVYDCINKKMMSLYYFQGSSLPKTLPNNISDLRENGSWFDLSFTRYVPTIYRELCEKNVFFK
jgi:hypothetical protein